MGRGRGKGKKTTAIAPRDDTASGEDEKLPVRRRGRPQKPIKDDIDEEDKVVNREEEDKDDSEVTKSSSILNKSTKNQNAVENGRKRKRPLQVNENFDSLNEQTNGNDLIKSVGYRQNGSRRKNKPTRAAEVGFECR